MASTVDLASYITDPSRAGYDLTLGAVPAGMSASLSGTVLSYDATVAGSYSVTLNAFSRHELAPVGTVSIQFTFVDEASRYANGYQFRSLMRLPVAGTGVYATFLLPVAEEDDFYKYKGNGGQVEHPQFFDVRYETLAGVKIPHKIIAYDGAKGRLWSVLNFSRDFGTIQDIVRYVGKPGLTVSEEDPVGARAGGWLAWNTGDANEDMSGLAHPWTTNTAVTDGELGPYPCGNFNGNTSYLGRTSSELGGLGAVTWVWCGQTPEAVGRAQEFFCIGTDTDTMIAARFTGTGTLIFSLNVSGTVQALQSDTGYYVPNRGIGIAGSWASGSTMQMYIDGEIMAPPVAATAYTGTITQVGTTLKLGAGRSTGTFWNGQCAALFLCSLRVPAAALQGMSAAFAAPHLVYSCGPWLSSGEARVGPIALPIEASGDAGTTVQLPVRAAAYNPDSDTLECVLPEPPDIGLSAIDATSGNPTFTIPSDRANQELMVPFAIQPAGENLRRSRGTARVGTRAAVVTPPTAGYDPSLPYGGQGVGITCLIGQPGNQKVSGTGYVTTRVEHTGSIDRISWHNKINPSGGSTGYVDGNGGIIHWSIRRITSALGSEALTLGPVLANTPNVTDPALDASWASAFTAAGGSGSRGRFREFPTLIFSPAVAVTAGEMIAFGHVQTSSSGAASYNCSYSRHHNVNLWSPWEYGKELRAYSPGSTSNQETAYLPLLIYGYTDNFIAGNPLMGYTATAPALDEIIIGQGDLGRLVAPMPSWAAGKKLKRVHAKFARFDNTTSADIVCRVRRAGGSPGGSSDNGTILGSPVTIAAAGVKYDTELKGGGVEDADRPLEDLVFDFSSQNITFASGDVIYFELATSSGSGTRYHGQQMQNYLQFVGATSTKGITTPTAHQNVSGVQMRGQINTGGTWASINTTGVNYVPIWAEFV